MQTRTSASTPRTLAIAAAAMQSLVVIACSKGEPPPRTASSSQPPMAEAPAAPAAAAEIVVSTTVRSKCDVPETSSEAPQFDFDDTALRPRGKGILDQVAQCMRDGSMKGEQVTVVGHTDPRGSDDYNRRLGMLRAEAARDYLTTQGVAAERITVKSRGEQDATGGQAGEWQLDRRVEIRESGEGSP